MNLHAIVAPIVSAINPWTVASIRRSTGSVINPDGSRTPSYALPTALQVQRQPLQYNDIAQLDSLNIQGTRIKLYLNGNWEGIVRPDQRGGDLITMPDGSVWLVVLVLENWSDRDGWTSVACTLQNGS